MASFIDILVKNGVRKGFPEDAFRARVEATFMRGCEQTRAVVTCELPECNVAGLEAALTNLDSKVWVNPELFLETFSAGVYTYAGQRRIATQVLRVNGYVPAETKTESQLRRYLTETGWSMRDEYLKHGDVGAACEAVVRRLAAHSVEQAETLVARLALPDEGLAIILGMLWAARDFPEVHVDDYSLAVSLMLKNPDQAQPLVPPWPAFWARIPRGLLFTYDAAGAPKEIYGALIGSYDCGAQGDVGWSFIVFSDDGHQLYGYNKSAQDMLTCAISRDELSPPLESHDDRVYQLACRYLCNVCQLIKAEPDRISRDTGRVHHIRGKAERDFVPDLATFLRQ